MARSDMIRQGSIVICATAALAIAGCTTTDQYVDDVNAVQEQVVEASKDVAADPNATRKEILEGVERAQSEAEEGVAELKDVDVPADAEDGHAALVEGFEELEALYADVKEQIESEESGVVDELRAESAKIDKEIDAALDQINSELGLD